MTAADSGPIARFGTVAIDGVDALHRVLRIWSAGRPAALVVSRRGVRITVDVTPPRGRRELSWLVANRKPAQPIVDARGRLLIERRGLSRGLGDALGKDAYHFLRTASWPQITLLFAGLFLAVNLVFAAILYLGGAEVMNAHGFLDDFWFSVQTLATIGYGYLAPADTLANTVVTVESFAGIGLTAMITGLFFARFATPYAKVIFSEVAIIGDHDGKRTLMFRMANARSTAIVEATCHVYVSRDEVLAGGERMRRIYDLPLRRMTSPIFSMSWLATHTIDAQSPIADLTPEILAATDLNFIVTFQGIDDRLAATVHTRYVYKAEDIVFDRRFADILHTDPETGRLYIDHDRFHVTEPVAGVEGNDRAQERA